MSPIILMLKSAKNMFPCTVYGVKYKSLERLPNKRVISDG